MPSGPTIDISHQLGQAGAKARIESRIGDLHRHIPGGMAKVSSSWTGPYQLALTIETMGQAVDSTIDIEDRIVRVQLILPPLLSFMAGPISAIVRKQGETLMLPDKHD